jgi:hypothetical protein
MVALAVFAIARPAFAEVMAGRLGRRNPYIVALDCFPPRMRAILFYGIQQLVRPNVARNVPYANVYLQMAHTLSPLNLVPHVPEVNKAMKWTMDELQPLMPVIERTCSPFRPI